MAATRPGFPDLRVFDGSQWQRMDEERGLPANIPFHLAENDGDLWVAE